MSVPGVAFAVAIIVMSSNISSVSQDQSACGDHATIKFGLLSRFGEIRQGATLPRSKSWREVYANLKTGTWTILAPKPGGRACIVQSGRGWRGAGQTGRERT